MAMNLRDFFDLDKVQFTDLELEAPYETYEFSNLRFKSFNYSTAAKLPTYNSDNLYQPKKLVLRNTSDIVQAEAA
ncbi:TPA: hypothetical protein U1D11_000504 [Streptococcus suis]|nr:hypothetical protein [Streptococcus suis]